MQWHTSYTPSSSQGLNEVEQKMLWESTQEKNDTTCVEKWKVGAIVKGKKCEICSEGSFLSHKSEFQAMVKCWFRAWWFTVLSSFFPL